MRDFHWWRWWTSFILVGRSKFGNGFTL